MHKGKGGGEPGLKEDDRLPFAVHLEELRRRLIVCLIAIGVGFVVSYQFKEMLFQVLTKPLVGAMEPGKKLIFTGITEAFFCYLNVAFIAGILLSMPVIMYEIWAFVASGLYRNQKRYAFPIVLLSSIFFVARSLFGYFIAFPFAFKYLLGFA